MNETNQIFDLIREIQAAFPELDVPQSLSVAILASQERKENSDHSLADCAYAARMKWMSMVEQQSAVAEELESLASSEPCEFEPTHIWTLIRVIKAQSRIVNLIMPEDSNALSG